MQRKLSPDTLIKSLKPILHEGLYVFCTMRELPSIDLNQIICLFREKEGVTLILRKDVADNERLPYSFLAAWITLTVHTSLQAVGLTAAISKALAERGISCNIVAGYYHDHLFVPKDKAQEAMKILNRLSDIGYK
jgi:hypothetical protein